MYMHVVCGEHVCACMACVRAHVCVPCVYVCVGPCMCVVSASACVYLLICVSMCADAETCKCVNVCESHGLNRPQGLGHVDKTEK